MTSPKMTAHDVVTALYRHFVGRWAVLTEVSARPERLDDETWLAYMRGQIRRDELAAKQGTYRRIDVLLLRARATPRPGPTVASMLAAPGPAALFDQPKPKAAPTTDDGGIERLAIEVKVSRSDFLQDIRNPDKQAPWRALAHRHAYAVPEGLVSVGEVPADSGLIVVGHAPTRFAAPVKFARKAPRAAHEVGRLPVANIMDAFYRAARLEAQVKGYSYDVERIDGDAETLRAEVERLRHELELAGNRTDRAAERAREWQRRYAFHEPPACATCGHPLHPAGRRRVYGVEWEHRDDVVEAGCKPLRTLAAEAARAALPADHWERTLRLVTPHPEPVEQVSVA